MIGLNAAVAQLAERRFRKVESAGSLPACGLEAQFRFVCFFCIEFLSDFEIRISSFRLLKGV
jgi:hypothetical protein